MCESILFLSPESLNSKDQNLIKFYFLWTTFRLRNIGNQGKLSPISIPTTPYKQ